MMDYIEVTGKTIDEAITNAAIKLEVSSDRLEWEELDKGSSGFLGIGSKPARIKVRKKSKTVEEVITNFLNDVFAAMDITVKIDVTIDPADETTINVDLSGDEMGVLIGKRGQTLDSLQYLVRLVVNKEFDGYLKVKIDTENYRARRKETLESLAKNIAYKVKRTKRPVSLEPMNPFERRIIHSALQNDRFVATKSEGEEPYRHIVVYLKR